MLNAQLWNVPLKNKLFELDVFFHAVHIKAAIQMIVDWTSYTASVCSSINFYSFKNIFKSTYYFKSLSLQYLLYSCYLQYSVNTVLEYVLFTVVIC